MKQDARVMTVTGEIAAVDLGFTLPHEHIMVDFIGARETGPHRYDRAHVVETMEPLLAELPPLGVASFVECTPMYLARDVSILVELSRRTGLKILTNTGQYKPPFLPDSTFDREAEEIAATWIAEWTDGIDGTTVRPGFIKTAVEKGMLPPVLRKTITAAAITSRETGLTVGTHCGCALAAREILTILERHGIEPCKWIFIHAQNENDHNAIVEIARRGAFIELDGIGPGTEEKHLKPLMKLLDAGYADRVLLSQDAGWYRVGEEPGGKKSSYTHLITEFLPMLARYGVEDDTARAIMITNPAAAYSIG